MPLSAQKKIRWITPILTILLIIPAIISGQTIPENVESTGNAVSQPEIKTLTPVEIMQARIAKAKAYIAVRNYAAATVELEIIRRDSGDNSLNSVATVLLMNSYIEHGEYQRASQLLEKLFTSYKANNAFSEIYYTNAAGQIIKSTRSKIERYQLLGLSVSDRNMPLEAVSDLEKSRDLLELLISQAKEIATDPVKMDLAAPLLEEATVTRSSLARDDYDAQRWRSDMADTREIMATSRSVVLSAIEDPNAPVEPIDNTQTASINNTSSVSNVDVSAAAKPSAETPAVIVTNDLTKQQEKIPVEKPIAEKPAEPVAEKNDNPLAVQPPPTVAANTNIGALLPYAVKRVQPVYPSAARTARVTGTVRVDISIDENGDVEEILKVTGNPMLQSAARDAILKWKFKSLENGGNDSVRTGFINFNFSL